MPRFVDTEQRLDVFFDSQETDFDVAAIILALCAYPEKNSQGHDGRAHRFWEAIYFFAAKDGRAIHPISGTPSRRPNRRSATAQLDRGFSNIYKYMQLHAAYHMAGAGGGALSFEMSRDLSRLKLTIALDDAGRMRLTTHPEPPSITKMLEYHQPVLGVGDDSQSGETETAKTLRKRYFAPMLRVDHIIGPLWSEVLTHHNPAEHPDWAAQLLKSDPAWAPRLIGKSRVMAPIKAQLARQRGVKTASVYRMIHFHLWRHVQLLPPIKAHFGQ